MEVHRIEGVKYNFDKLKNEELENMRSYLNERVITLMGEIALLDNELFARHHRDLPFEEA